MALLSAHGVPMLTDHGYTPMFASWALGVLGGSSIGFTVMLGALSDRLGRRPVLAAIYAGRIAIFAGFFLIRDNPTAILVVAALGGITMAGTGSMTSALTADIYGRFSVSSVFGLIFLVHQTGSALGSWLAGALFERTGGYGAAYVLACAFLASCVAFARVWHGGSFTSSLFTWIVAGDFEASVIAYVDPLTGVMLLVVTGVGSLIHLYSPSRPAASSHAARAAWSRPPSVTRPRGAGTAGADGATSSRACPRGHRPDARRRGILPRSAAARA